MGLRDLASVEGPPFSFWLLTHDENADLPALAQRQFFERCRPKLIREARKVHPIEVSDRPSATARHPSICGGSPSTPSTRFHRLQIDHLEPLQELLAVLVAERKPSPPCPFQCAHPQSPPCRGNDNPGNQNREPARPDIFKGCGRAVPASFPSAQSTFVAALPLLRAMLLPAMLIVAASAHPRKLAGPSERQGRGAASSGTPAGRDGRQSGARQSLRSPSTSGLQSRGPAATLRVYSS